jgi:hypothetical protein
MVGAPAWRVSPWTPRVTNNGRASLFTAGRPTPHPTPMVCGPLPWLSASSIGSETVSGRTRSKLPSATLGPRGSTCGAVAVGFPPDTPSPIERAQRRLQVCVNTPSTKAGGFSGKLCGNPLAWRLIPTSGIKSARCSYILVLQSSEPRTMAQSVEDPATIVSRFKAGT